MDPQREEGDADLKFDFRSGGKGCGDPPLSPTPSGPTSMKGCLLAVIEGDDDVEEKGKVLIWEVESSGEENRTPIAMDNFAPTTMTEEFVAAAAAGLSGDKQEKDGDLGSHMEVAAAAGLSLDKQEKDVDSGSQMELEEEEEEEPMTQSHWKEYLRQVKQSEGFDVGYFPRRLEDNLLCPMGGPYNDNLSIEIAQHAINHHNKKNKDGQLKLERVVKIIGQFAGWFSLYVTLEAFDTADQQVKTYQALVETIPQLGGRVLKMFRLKPSSSETQPEKKHPLGGCCGECYRKEEQEETEEDVGPNSEGCHSPPLKKPKIDPSDEVEEDSDSGYSAIEQEQDTQSPSYSSGDDQDDGDEPHDDHPEEFEPYLEFLKACDERDDQLFNNVSPETALQNLTELCEKEGECWEGVKYTLENVQTYYEELEESEGFDITRFPDMENLCFVTPVAPPWEDCVTKHVELAIEILNKKEGASFELLEITKVNYLKICCCPHSYITFNVKVGADDEYKTCQARVLIIPGREKVEEVRLKSCKS